VIGVHTVELYAMAKMSVNVETGMQMELTFHLMNLPEFVLTMCLLNQNFQSGIHQTS